MGLIRISIPVDRILNPELFRPDNISPHILIPDQTGSPFYGNPHLLQKQALQLPLADTAVSAYLLNGLSSA